MQRSENRILTSHAGSLPRPDALIEMNQARLDGRAVDDAAFSKTLTDSVASVVREEVDAGVDVVNDGEYGKASRGTIDYGPWMSYAYERITGWELDQPSSGGVMAARRDRQLFPGAYSEITSGATRFAATTPRVFTGPVSYVGEPALKADIENLKAAMQGAGAAEVFMTSVAPGSFGRRQNRYYKTDEEFVFAVAEAMREEYRAIIDAGFVLQLDDPGLPDSWDMFNPEPPLGEYKRYASVTIEALNHALEGLPEDRVRYHICWGSWHGPHTTDLPLKDIVDMLLSVRAGCYSVEAGNVRHEHEWKVWRDVKLPDGKILMPGVVSHATNVVEHPEVVADRIVRYASVVGRENVIAGTDCGLGGRIHSEIAWAKLRALVEGAKLASQELW
ncbi:MAG TPA: cobalamin-independent methionine synthase II family protein [Dehalococcoidia bacterium]|nr:cobalamin-independent methionine synthase II family protein [Dehalococcoidia bacterium]